MGSSVYLWPSGPSDSDMEAAEAALDMSGGAEGNALSSIFSPGMTHLFNCRCKSSRSAVHIVERTFFRDTDVTASLCCEAVCPQSAFDEQEQSKKYACKYA